MNQGRLLVISGPSGTGKGTIVSRIMAERKDTELSISMTTRGMRPGEVHGVNYYFVEKEEFEKTIAEGGLLEHAQVFENYYGTPKAMVLEKLAQGKDVILEIDVQGAMKVKESYPEGVFIFILPPSMKELRRRITDRATDAPEVIDLRMSKALGEINYVKNYDYAVVNDDLDQAVAAVKGIIESEHLRVDQDIDLMIKKYEEEV